ncbi:MAG: glutathione S-transferase C-terminal domain-containing protein, partial [Pseudomonadota bacterium]
RQVGRVAMVAGTGTGSEALVEATTHAVLAALETQVEQGFFLFGTRPSHAEFALYGQLAQLADDPTPMALMRDRYPYVARWLSHIADLSGVDGTWGAPGPGVAPLLSVIGEVYLPFLIANAKAITTGAETVRLTAHGHDYEQAPFRYQAKCLATLRAQYAALDTAARQRIDPLLKETGCLPHLKDD